MAYVYNIFHWDEGVDTSAISAVLDAEYLKLDCSNDPLTGLLNIQNSVQIQGNYNLSFRDLAGTTNYMYISATTAPGGGAKICPVNVPFQLQYGAVGSEVQLSMDTNGNLVWNYDAQDCDFTISKLTAGQAYVYDAGLDTHTFDGQATFDDVTTFEGSDGTDAVKIVSGKRLVFDA